MQEERCPEREVMKKVKAQMEIKLATDVKINDKRFYSYKKKGRLRKSRLQNGAWNLMSKEAEVFCTAFISTFAMTVSEAVQAID